MKELGEGKPTRRADGSLIWNAPAKQYYTVFFGRGMMQLTWAGNYDDYGKFRSLAQAPNGTYHDTRITATSEHYWADPRDSTGRVIAAPQVWANRPGF